MLKGGVKLKEKKDINIEIGNRIKKAREMAGLTQDRFAELIGMGTKNISAIERGAVGVSLSSIKKICLILSISSDDLLFESRTENDMSTLTSRLKRLPPEQFNIANDILNKLLEAFAISDKQ
jgi:transcriptional regulator with XRE-family HTH domain